MIVVDASTIIEILRRTPAGEKFAVALSGSRLHAPHLLDIEVVSALRKLVRLKIMTPAEADEAIEAFLAIPIVRYAHTELIEAVWALRHDLTSYDAIYFALARALDAQLVTMDEGLRKRAQRRPH